MTSRIASRVIVTVRRKGCELYVIRWRPCDWHEALLQLGRWAKDADLSFGWLDAKRMGGDMAEERRQCEST